MTGGSIEELESDVRAALDGVRGAELAPRELADRAVSLAHLLQRLSELDTTSREREQAEVLWRMMRDQRGQIFTTLLADRAYRSPSKKRTVEQARYLLHRLGPPEYLGRLESLGLAALRQVGSWLPTLSGTAMLNRIEHESSAFILPDDSSLEAFLAQRAAEGTNVNINHLGEEVLGEREAQRRVEGYVALLERPCVETLSVKVSSIFSQLDPLAFDQCVETLCARLRPLYRQSLVSRCADGTPKLVMLDMEAYRDVRLTLSSFQHILDEPEFLEVHAGVALQAYLPDTQTLHAALTDWAKRRSARGGAPIRMRIVKGANLAMERVDSAVRGWSLPIYPNKPLVDANYKRLLIAACRPENARVATVGIASHNLFDVCFGLLLRSSGKVERHISFELLEGMADPLRRTLKRLGADVLVYAPIVGKHEFPSAIAYLVRRLDENTSLDNYLPHSFRMRVDSAEWRDQEARFRASCDLIESVAGQPRRAPRPEASPAAAVRGPSIRSSPSTPSPVLQPFANEPDTDWGQAEHRAWIARHLQQCLDDAANRELVVRSHISGASPLTGESSPGFDPSRPGAEPYRIELAGPKDIESALVCASAAHQRGAKHTGAERRTWLANVGNSLRRARGELIALMVMDSGKRVEEADVEISEAIDFAEYYLRRHRLLEQDPSIVVTPRGPVVVTPPWNFPLAIPLGGVFAALVLGNPVILKPALETPLVARRACELAWEAGVPEEMLQLVVCVDDVATPLVRDPRTRVVVLTGATSTARLFHSLRPGLRLLAETGGKNSLYVSAMSDREQAVTDAVASAFGHAGQKCSALSQLILHRELYDDQDFLELLRDATTSVKVGSAWELDSVVTPMIHPSSELQRQALTTLLPGESWLVQPEFNAANPRLVSPGVKLGVAPGSVSHRTEFFCPLLSVLRANSLRSALNIANDTAYGLTAGIHSLDEREHDAFIDEAQAGNLYINRKITGAIVGRQPFGGWKASSFGPGAKAGGPNYVAQFADLQSACRDTTSPPEAELTSFDPPRLPERVERWFARLLTGPPLAPVMVHELRRIAADYVRVHTRYFAGAHDPSHIRGEDNILRYRPLSSMLVVADASMTTRQLALIGLGGCVCECPIELSVMADAPAMAFAEHFGATPETPLTLRARLESCIAERVRSIIPLPEELLATVHRKGAEPVTAAPLDSGRYELLHFLREQSVSVRYHRYGHLGLRGEVEENTDCAGPNSV
jgi:RHH-type proline utilization regulon transcriptional repressor/proline dehydrogenase/delta 1-pyrroline-5-carboxylate dehydrogenase